MANKLYGGSNQVIKAYFGDSELEQLYLGEIPLLSVEPLFPIPDVVKSVGFNVKLTNASLFVQSQYTANSVAGEKVKVDLSPISALVSSYLRSDCSNIRFYDPETNTLLKHKFINNQGIQFFLVEIPHEIIQSKSTISNTKTIPLKVLISDKAGNYSYAGDTSIFKYYYNIKELGTYPSSNYYSMTNYPSQVARTPTTATVNTETVLSTPSQAIDGFIVGNFNFLEVFILMNPGATHQHATIALFQPYFSTGELGWPSNTMGYCGDFQGTGVSSDWNRPCLRFLGNPSNTYSKEVTMPTNTWHLCNFKSQNSSNVYFYPNLITNPSNNVSILSTTHYRTNTYFVIGKWSSTQYTSFVFSLQNPYGSKNGGISVTDFILE